MKYVVIGGNAGGASFATRMRRLDENAEIIIINKGSFISYASCALPYYLGDIIPERDKIIERTPEALKIKNNIEVRVEEEAVAIDSKNKTVSIKSLSTGDIYKESYDKLILSSGASPVIPPIKNLETATNAFSLRTVTDADAIKDFINTHNVKTVSIIGGGMASLEITENLVHRGLKATIIERSEHVGSPYDSEIAEIVEDELTQHGVKIMINQNVTNIINEGKSLQLDDGSIIDQDMIIVATGVKPNTEYIPSSGISLTDTGFVPVNEKLETTVKDIYGIGDIIMTNSYINDLPIPSVLSSPANRQGHLLADIFAGYKFTYPGLISSGVAKVFDLTASYVGYSEQTLLKNGITNFQSVFITPFSHAYFYPDAKRLNLKLIFENETGKILGGQAIGETGVDKRIGELSTAIYGHMTVYDLPALELPYSPPYSTTRDPLNTIGYVAINALTNKVATLKIEELTDEVKKHAFFLDIREHGKKETGSITPDLNIPLTELRDRIDEIPKDKNIFITYRKGLNNYTAARILAGNKFDVTIIEE